MQAFPSLWLLRRERGGKWVRQGKGRIKGGRGLVQERVPQSGPGRRFLRRGVRAWGTGSHMWTAARRPGGNERVLEASAGRKVAFRCAGESGSEGTRSRLLSTRTPPASHCPDSAIRLASRLPTSGPAAPGPGGRGDGTGKDSSLGGAALQRLLPQVPESQERLHPGVGGGLSYAFTLPRLPASSSSRVRAAGTSSGRIARFRSGSRVPSPRWCIPPSGRSCPERSTWSPWGPKAVSLLGQPQGFSVSGGLARSYQKWVPSGLAPAGGGGRRGPGSGSHCRFPLSVNFLLLPLHLAEAVEATEAGESELGHALGQAGGSSPEKICRERQGRKRGKREKQAGVNVPRALRGWPVTATPQGCPGPANPLAWAGGMGHHTTASVRVRVS